MKVEMFVKLFDTATTDEKCLALQSIYSLDTWTAIYMIKYATGCSEGDADRLRRMLSKNDKTKITELQSVINKQNKIIDSIKHNTPDNINNNKGFLIDSIKTDTVKK